MLQCVQEMGISSFLKLQFILDVSSSPVTDQPLLLENSVLVSPLYSSMFDFHQDPKVLLKTLEGPLMWPEDP